MGILNQYGYQTTTISQKITALQTLFQTAFGSDIILDDTSPQGQLITYLATLMDNEDKIGLSFFEALDYHNATGAILSLIAISKGQARSNGTKAVITATFTSSTTGYTISTGSTFALTSDSTIIFQVLANTAITSTSQVISLEAVNNQYTGAIITDNLTALNNYPLLTDIEILTITDGTNIESDVELIARLDNSDTETGINDFNSIVDKLNLITNVSRCRVFDNDTNTTQNSVPAHNIMCQVVGGTAADITQVIVDNKATGTATYGNTSYSLTDSEGYPKTIYYNIPSEKTIYVQITMTKRNNIPIDTTKFDTYKTNTQDYINSLLIGDDVSYTAVFGIWGVGNYNITKLELSFNGITYYETDLTIAFTEYATMNNTTTQINIITL
jgi:hypothetical protein